MDGTTYTIPAGTSCQCRYLGGREPWQPFVPSRTLTWQKPLRVESGFFTFKYGRLEVRVARGLVRLG